MVELLGWSLVVIVGLLLLCAALWCLYLALAIVHGMLALLLLPFGINLYKTP